MYRLEQRRSSQRPRRRLTTFDSNGGLITKHAPLWPCPLFISISFFCVHTQAAMLRKHVCARGWSWSSAVQGVHTGSAYSPETVNFTGQCEQVSRNHGGSFSPPRCNFRPRYIRDGASFVLYGWNSLLNFLPNEASSTNFDANFWPSSFDHYFHHRRENLFIWRFAPS